MSVSAWARLPTRRACWKRELSAGLAEDLALAHDHRVQPRGDVEEVGHGRVVVVHVQVRKQQLVGLGARLEDHPRDRLDTAVEAVDLGEDLDPVAGREHGRLDDVLEVEHVADQLVRALAVTGDLLEDRHGRGVVGHAHHQDTHATTPGSRGPGVAGVALRCSW
jgi:hypothetical protein